MSTKPKYAANKVLGINLKLGLALVAINLLFLVLPWLVIHVADHRVSNSAMGNLAIMSMIYASGLMGPFSVAYIVDYLARRRASIWQKIGMVALGFVLGLNIIFVAIFAAVVWALKDI